MERANPRKTFLPPAIEIPKAASFVVHAPAPKTAEEKEADINRREKNRSAQYSQLPEVRAGNIKRAEASGDMDKVRELTRADDVEAWAKEQVNSEAVRKEAQRRYDEEFARARIRGDMSPAVSADKAANAYLDLYRNRAQKVREDTYNFRQYEKRSALENEAASQMQSEGGEESLHRHTAVPLPLGQGRLGAGEEISALINNPEEREKYRSIDKRFGESSETLAHVEAMTDAEKKTIQYFASTGQYDKVEEYYELLKTTLNKRVQEARNKQTYKEAYEKPVTGAVKNVMASFATPAAYVANTANAVGNIFRDEYVPTDTNTDAFSGAHAAKQTSAGVTERAYDAAGGGTKGELASLLAGTGLSMANFLSKAPLGATGAMLAMGADTAGQTTLDVLERGGTAGQALFLSTAAGAIEALTEKMPLDNLFRTAKDVGKTGIKTTIKSVLKQSGMEATEEMVSELANTALDIAVMRDNSEYRSYISELEASGMSRAEAEKEAFFQYFGKNILLAGAGGAISGAAMGGGASAISGINTNTNRNRAGGGFVSTKYSDKITNKQIRALDAVGKRLGVKISIGAPTGNADGAHDGYYKNGEIVIAQDAKNPLEVVLAHEVAHHMKSTAPAEYNAFLELAVNASERLSNTEKSELINRYKTAYSEGTQTEFSDAQALDEIAADFTSRIVKDVKMFDRLAQDNRNAAMRFIDSIKDFISKVKSTFSGDKAKADTAAREKYGAKTEELERATYLWEKMLSDTEAAVASGNKNTAGTSAGGVRMYSLKSFEDGKRFVDVETDQNLFDGLTDNEKGKMATRIIKERFAGKVVGRDNKVFVNGRSATEYGHPSKKLDAPEQNAKMRASTELDNLIDAGDNFRTAPDGADGHIHPKATGDFKYFDTIFKVGDEYFEGRINILPNAKGDRLIDVTRIKNITQDICSSYGENPKSTFLRDNSEDVPSSDNNIPQTPEKSNSEFSQKNKTDSSGRELTQEQAEYFKDSKARDEDGNLLVMYHQTGDDFTVFDVKKEGAGTSDNQTPFGIFMKTSDADIGLQGKKQMMLYANITNPLYAESRDDLSKKLREISPEFAHIESELKELNIDYKGKHDKADKDLAQYLVEWRKNNPEASRAAVYDDAGFKELYDMEDQLIEEWGRKDAELSLKAKTKITEAMKRAGYDGIILASDSGSFGRTTDAYIALSPNQVKNIDNGNPTSDPDINFSLKTEDLLSPDYGKADSSAEPQNDTGFDARDTEVVISKKENQKPSDTTEEGSQSSYIEETGLDTYFNDLEDRAQVIQKKRVADAEKALMKAPGTDKKSGKEKVEESVSFLKRKMVNSADTIRKIAKTTKDKHLYPALNRARSSMNIVSDMLQNKQTNIRGQKVGESLEGIIAPVKEKGDEYFRKFQLYLLHKHNVSRMSLKDTKAEAQAQAELELFIKDNPGIAAMGETALQKASMWDDDKGFRAKEYIELRDRLNKAQNTKNKPIFFDSDDVPLNADESRHATEELLRENPGFAEDEKKIRTYLDNLMQYRVDSGLITQEEADYFKKKYPDYVPTYRNTESIQKQIQGKTNIGKTVGRATGGNDPIIPLDVALSEMTKKVVRSGQKNIFANKVFELFDKNSKLLEKYITDVQEGERDVDTEIDSFGEEAAFDNTVTFHKDGKLIELTVTPELYEAFDTLSRVPKEQPAAAQAWRKVNEIYKKLITTYDVTFIARNGLKDLFDGIFQSRNAGSFLKNYGRAYKEIATGGEMWELYQAAGGLYSSRFEELQEKGITEKSGKLNIKEKLAFGNMMVEQAPRLAEFMSVVEKGDINDADTIADALLAAADVTTNFGESGTWGKVLNAYYIPFLNPAIQGTAKVVRTFTESKTGKEWIGLAVKCMIYGLGAGFLNDLINGDDEDYENLPDRTKDNYFLIRAGDGKFLRLPKGRIMAALGVVTDRLRDVMKGEKVDAGEALSRISENILPENPLNNNIFKAWFDADLLNDESKGRTWYGTDIENETLQSLPAGERYDNSTDYVSKAIGKALGVSPKKLNYILQQYTGGIGRTVLPMITPKEQKGDSVAGKIGYGLLGILTSNFTTDSKLSNKISGEFYDAVDAATQKKNSEKGTLADKVVYKHLNRERNMVGEYSSKVREAEVDKNLTSKERQAAVRAASAERTAYQKTILENLDKYRESVEKYLKKYPGEDEEKKLEYAYREANRAMYGEEYAIRANGGSDVYKKAQEKVKRGKTTWAKYYDEYFGKAERRFEKISDRFGISYAEFEKIADAISKNSTKDEKIEAIKKLGYKRSVARRIYNLYNDAE
ncbi:MAG: hypothetical protein E7441_05800 [Ruminococcaceae bacterium]|nr:hypothetical protein [Oscillospiraceae bacterium]